MYVWNVLGTHKKGYVCVCSCPIHPHGCRLRRGERNYIAPAGVAVLQVHVPIFHLLGPADSEVNACNKF